MKHLLTSLFLLLALLLPTTATAYDFVVNGIAYNIISDNTIEVTFGMSYSGNLSIPVTVDYGGKTYLVSAIGNDAFSFCTDLKRVTISNSVITIGNNAFYRCEKLTDIFIPNSVKIIGSHAFCDCWALVSALLPSQLEVIGDAIFLGCYKLESNIIIPKTVTSIGNYPFAECNSLTTIEVELDNPLYDSRNNCNAIIETTTNTLICGINTSIIPKSVVSIGDYAFRSCRLMENIIIPENVTSIGNGAFYDNLKLKEIHIPNSVTTIGRTAFGYCNELISVTIGNTVTKIDAMAFADCNSLTDVYSYITDLSIVTLDPSAFSSSYSHNYSNRTLHVPLGSLSTYQENSSWSNYFGSIVEMEPEVVLASSIELDMVSAEVTAGETLQLIATVHPLEATNKDVTWISSDETIASVDNNGLVTAIAPGTSIITAVTTDGSNLSASCVLTIKPHASVMNGDVNGDGNISLDDLTTLINYLLTGHYY